MTTVEQTLLVGLKILVSILLAVIVSLAISFIFWLIHRNNLRNKKSIDLKEKQ
jgi:hypothetical protein